jgi:hypothetical protein
MNRSLCQLRGAGAAGSIGFGQPTTMSLVPTADTPDLGVLAPHSPTMRALYLDSDGFVDLAHMPHATEHSVFSPSPASERPVKITSTQDAPNPRLVDADGDGLVDMTPARAFSRFAIIGSRL